MNIKGPSMIDQLPVSIRGRVRFTARSAWMSTCGDFDNACAIVTQVMGETVEPQFEKAAIGVAKVYLVHWDQNHVTEPSSVAMVGEPFTRFEDDET